MDDAASGQIRAILDSALATQQPFFAELLNRFAAMESREIKRQESLDDLKVTIRIIADRDYQRQIDELEKDFHQRLRDHDVVCQGRIDDYKEACDERLEQMERDVSSLKDTRTEWQGVVKAGNWAPKLIAYLGILVTLIIAYSAVRK